MYRRLTKRQRALRQVLTYTLMTIAVIVIVTVSVLFIMGYRLNSTSGGLVQGVLVQFGSKPSGATITIDGKTLTGSLGDAHTPNKASLTAGTHTFTYQKAGYATWSKTLSLGAGTLSWLDYARLVPTKLPVTSVADYPALASATVSPNEHFILLQPDAATPNFSLVDINGDKIKTTDVALPSATYTAADAGTTNQFTVSTWDGGSRFVLVHHTYGDKSEWLVLDTHHPDQSKNISGTLGVTGVTSMNFASTSGGVFYGIDNGGTLRKYDVNAGTISRALVNHVTSYHLYQNNIISYTSTDDATPVHQVAGVYRDGDDAPIVITSVDTTQPAPEIAITNFYNNYYVAIAEGSSLQILSGGFPSSQSDVKSLQQFAKLTLPFASAATMTFSPSGQYLLAQNGTQYLSYDLEYQRSATATVASTTATPHALTWLDNAYLWTDDDGELSIREFDGTNVHTINPVAPGFITTLTPNSKYLYSIGKKDTGYQLQRVQMILS